MFTQELKKSSKKLDDFSFYEAIYYQVIQTLLLFVFICFIVYFLFYFIYLFIHLCIYFVVCFLGGGYQYICCYFITGCFGQSLVKPSMFLQFLTNKTAST